MSSTHPSQQPTPSTSSIPTEPETPTTSSAPPTPPSSTPTEPATPPSTASGKKRTFIRNLTLASSAAGIAGMTNLAGMLTCYSFISNVTGHTVSFARKMLQENWFEMVIILVWMCLFLAGAAIARFLIRYFQYKNYNGAHYVPLALEAAVLLFVGVYGEYFHQQTVAETQILAALLLFSMGIQNSAVSTITGQTGQGIKTTHMTGLFTDLGTDLADILHARKGRGVVYWQGFYMRVSILGSYIGGALLSGWGYFFLGFKIFYVIALLLVALMIVDRRLSHWVHAAGESAS